MKKRENRNYQDIEKRTFLFAIKVIKLVLALPKNNVVTWKLGGQVISSATSVNSNIVQAKAGVSKKDFINHYKIARKEAKETKRWLQMLQAAGLISEEEGMPLLQENEEIIKILVTIVKNAEKHEK